ncbi:MAG: CPBP family intramembrane metalloprotease [Ruminococcaceae bacterium]|nr:CPBP family intramembrane metalloprotease [Oscillospiraceae bacterium]
MKKLFEKHETLFCMLLIIIYLVVNSVCVQNFGYTSCVSFIANTILSAFLIVLMVVLKRTSYYGLKKIENAKQYLYFIPLLVIITVNLWNGFNINNSSSEIVFHSLTMINIGFIEEIIFRGFLFKMMAKTNVKSAIIVSAVTFGAGHIVNLINGAELIPTLIQICYATSIGYLFVILFHKSKSLVPCIITHSLVNSLSVFNVENTMSMYIAPVFLVVIPVAYAIYINKKVRE